MAAEPRGVQSTLFYDTAWTWKVDRRFVEVIAREASIGHFWWGQANWSSVYNAMWTVNHEFGTGFTYEQCERRLRFLEFRYRTFKAIIETPGVHYDVRANCVSAEDHIWDRICYTFKLGCAYRPFGEPEWSNLSFIYNEDHTYGANWRTESDPISLEALFPELFKDAGGVPEASDDVVYISSDEADVGSDYEAEGSFETTAASRK